METEKTELEHTPVEQPLPSIHPNLAELYRGKVARLELELAHPGGGGRRQIPLLRSMISTIVITPGAKRGEVGLELHGELAGILLRPRPRRTKAGHTLREFNSRWLRGPATAAIGRTTLSLSRSQHRAEAGRLVTIHSEGGVNV